MAKGKQAAVAEQKIEGTGKQRKAQYLHDEDRIEDKRCDDEQHEKAGEDRHMVPRHALRANGRACRRGDRGIGRSEEHTSELKSLMRTSHAVFCLKKTIKHRQRHSIPLTTNYSTHVP